MRWLNLLWVPLLVAGCIRPSEPLEGDWEYFPAELFFDTVVGRTSTETFTIKNNRSSFLTINISRAIPDGDCPEEPFLPPPRSTRIAPGTFQEIRIDHSPQVLPPSGKCTFLLNLSNEADTETGKRTIRLEGEVDDVDADMDGWGRGEGDCNDLEPTINPGVQEDCNGFDDDCDGLIDDADDNEAEKYIDPEGPVAPDPLVSGQDIYHPDFDGDSFPRRGSALLACGQPVGWVLPPVVGNGLPNEGWDCNDQLNDIYPDAVEIAGEGQDRNCDGFVTCYLDLDTDGDGDDNPASVVAHSLSDPFCQNLVPGTQGPVSRNNDDCDDTNAAINKNALEVCGQIIDGSAGIDENCNGFIDDADIDLTDPEVWFFDADGDSFGQSDIVERRCAHSPPAGFVDNPTDCNDGNARIFPGAQESCNGGIDDDCDGLADDLDPERDDLVQFDQSSFRDWWVDADSDGYGDDSVDMSDDSQFQRSCTLPLGFSPNNTDCDDGNATINPGAPEEPGDRQDQDCDGLEACYVDADADSYGSNEIQDTPAIDCAGFALRPGDCDDNDARGFPGNQEVCDGVDNDCDTRVDDADDSVSAVDIFYRDADGDNFGDPGFPRIACQAPLGFVVVDPAAGDEFDCFDQSAAVYPGAPETVADGFDQSCDGLELCFTDADNDGYGHASNTTTSTDLRCIGNGVSEFRSDCNDADAAINPGVVERCDPDDEDEDCDGLTDDEDNDAIGRSLWYPDADSDTFGSILGGQYACDAPLAHVAISGDCNDRNQNINPLATEICNTVDDDCDSFVDDADGGVDLGNPLSPAPNWYQDIDNDGYGDDAGTPVQRCAQPLGFVSAPGDCRDDRPDINPGAVEGIADGVDQNCDGDESCYRDNDDDGWGTNTLVDVPVGAGCEASGEAVRRGDCDDGEVTVAPDQIEICDGVDNDCDNLTDDADDDTQPGTADTVTWLRDADADGYGDLGSVIFACVQPSGFVPKLNNPLNPASGEAEVDCFDGNAAINPGASERPSDRLDSNCDGLEICFSDADDDGFGDSSGGLTAASADIDCLDANRSLNQGDCDDSNPLVNPNGTEVCDPLDADEDCDGLVDDGDGSTIGGLYWYRDGDGDGEGTVDIVAVRCEAPPGFVSNALDCNDVNTAINTSASEVCDPLNSDEDCDGLADDLDSNVLPSSQRRFFADRDGDGFGDDAQAGAGRLACDPGLNESTNAVDCNDFNPAVKPGATEVPADGLDSDCNGVEACFCNQDGDTVGVSNALVASADLTCAPPAVPPAIPAASCDAADSPSVAPVAGDCDDQSSGIGQDETAWFLDGDNDGFGNPSVFVVACLPPSTNTWVLDSSDCRDSDPSVNPAATEICDPANIDENCNGIADDIDSGHDPATETTFYIDGDGDTYGSVAVSRCDLTVGLAVRDGDCDDSNPGAVPNGVETPADGIDGNCDGEEICYCDKDGDGVGLANQIVRSADLACTAETSPFPIPAPACTTPGVGVTNITGDCNDGDAGVVSATTLWFFDQDGDGFGNENVFLSTCEPPATTGVSQWVTIAGDCADVDPARNPTATETCNGIDDDCNGAVDEGGDSQTWYADNDSDGFGNPSLSQQSCEAPGGFVLDNTDCDDADGDNFPGNPEICDGVDNNCVAGISDEAPTTWYHDNDSDTWGDDGDTELSCAQPPNHVARGGDCDDARDSVNPGAAEICNNRDDNCDGFTNEGLEFEWWRDADGDGRGDQNSASRMDCDEPGGGDWVINDDDCDDTNIAIFVGATEVCDGDDNNCDGNNNEGLELDWWLDDDGDGQGDENLAAVADCADPSGGGDDYVQNDDDCDDSDAAVFDGATEVCDGTDNNCNGFNNEGLALDWWLDDDGDGQGDENFAELTQCGDPSGGGDDYVNNGDDCDDTDGDVFDGATELCDGIDNDCDPATEFDDGAMCGATGVGWYDPVGMGHYIFINSSLNLADANAECAMYPGYRMVFLETLAEEQAVTDEIALQGLFGTNRFWLGVSATCGATWAWDGGSVVCSEFVAASYEESRVDASALFSAGGGLVTSATATNEWRQEGSGSDYRVVCEFD